MNKDDINNKTKQLVDENKILKENIKELTIKLNDRNPAFNGNLIRRSEKTLYELEIKIGNSLCEILGHEIIECFKGKSFYLSYEHSLYMGDKGYWKIIFSNNNDRDKVLSLIQHIELNKFLKAIENFSWATHEDVNK